MNPTKCFDSSAWLAYYFAEHPTPRKYIESSTVISASVITIFEVDRRLRRLNYTEQDVEEFIEFIQNRAIIVDTTPTLCQIASKLSIKHKLGAMDAFMLASAQVSSATLVTGDPDFKNVPDVELIS